MILYCRRGRSVLLCMMWAHGPLWLGCGAYCRMCPGTGLASVVVLGCASPCIHHSGMLAPYPRNTVLPSNLELQPHRVCVSCLEVEQQGLLSFSSNVLAGAVHPGFPGDARRNQDHVLYQRGLLCMGTVKVCQMSWSSSSLLLLPSPVICLLSFLCDRSSPNAADRLVIL